MYDAEMKINELTESIIAAAIEVHKTIGPGLLESAYSECLSREFAIRKIQFEREKTFPSNTKV